MDCSKQLVKHEATTEAANNQLVPSTPISQPRIRTNIVLLQPLRFYVPDNDASVPYALIMGRQTVASARGCRRGLLSGYFSILCAVLPDLTDVAKKIVENLGFQAEEIAVPSQAAEKGIAIPQSQDLMIEAIKFAQMLLLPFQIRFDSEVSEMWEGVARDVRVVDLSSLMVCTMDDMKAISADLQLSKLGGELRRGIASSLQNLAATNSPFGHIISTAKQRAVDQRYELSRGNLYGYTLYGGL